MTMTNDRETIFLSEPLHCQKSSVYLTINFFFSSKVSETKMSVFSMVNKIPSGQFAGRKTVKRTNQEIGMKPYLMWTICGIYSDSVTLK